jgi:hypothetical protein
MATRRISLFNFVPEYEWPTMLSKTSLYMFDYDGQACAHAPTSYSTVVTNDEFVHIVLVKTRDNAPAVPQRYPCPGIYRQHLL